MNGPAPSSFSSCSSTTTCSRRPAMRSNRRGRLRLWAAMALLAAPWPAGRALAETQPTPDAADLSDRRATLQALSADERERLRRNLERVETLDEPEKQRLGESAARV